MRARRWPPLPARHCARQPAEECPQLRRGTHRHRAGRPRTHHQQPHRRRARPDPRLRLWPHHHPAHLREAGLADRDPAGGRHLQRQTGDAGVKTTRRPRAPCSLFQPPKPARRPVLHSGRALADRRHLWTTLQAIPEGRQQQGTQEGGSQASPCSFRGRARPRPAAGRPGPRP